MILKLCIQLCVIVIVDQLCNIKEEVIYIISSGSNLFSYFFTAKIPVVESRRFQTIV